MEQAAGGATLIVLISLFLPWFGFGANASVSGTAAHGYLAIVVLLAVLMAGYLLQRSGRDEAGFRLPVAPETLLLAGAGLQFAAVVIAFCEVPPSGHNREYGAYLALIAAAAAGGAAAIPPIRSRQARH